MKNALLLLLPTAVLLGGCSSFDAKWRAAGQPGALQRATRWDGRWTSEHHRSPLGGPAGGRLRCVLEPVDRAQTRAHFHANWSLFSADYTVPLQVEAASARRGGVQKLSGTHRLPAMFGGLYHYSARVTERRFSARYSSSYDAGTFEMTRQLTKPTRIH